MNNENIENNKEIITSNIFDDFGQDSNLIEEVDRLKKEGSRDKFYYISKWAYVLQTIFWFSVLIYIALYSYIYIQKNENIKDSSMLDPLCFIFLWGIINEDTYCSSISSLNTTYANKSAELKNAQAKSIMDILEQLYKVENFSESKEVIFLWDKSKNKLKVLEILEKFDSLKNSFVEIDKAKVQCSSLVIDSSSKTLSMNCVAFSAWYEKWLKWFDAKLQSDVRGTSISLANSFLNYITKTSRDFIIIDRQKIFKLDSVVWDETDFTNKTNFTLKLKYNL